MSNVEALIQAVATACDAARRLGEELKTTGEAAIVASGALQRLAEMPGIVRESA